MRVLTVNAGSSSLKVRLLDATDTVERSSEVEVGEEGVDAAALSAVLGTWPAPAVVAHRVVHGGPRFTGPVLVDADVRLELEALTSLAPLHQPRALAALDVVRDLMPRVPAVACLDTAFHRTIPAAASTYALPAAWRAAWPLQRYGFHGLSHQDASTAAARMVGRDPEHLRTVTCHLGAGASLCAVRDGRSIDTTMGFTPMEGLVMATRSGSVDPGLLLWLLQEGRLSLDELVHGIEHRAGMLGLTGTTDLRVVIERAAAGDEQCVLGLDVYVHHLVAGIAAMTASLGGIDLLVFTGGVGEGASVVRRRAVEVMAHVGLEIDVAANAAVTEGIVSTSASAAGVVVVHAREDRQMAREARHLLGP